MNATSQPTAPSRGSSSRITLAVGALLMALGLWHHQSASAHVQKLETEVQSLRDATEDIGRTLRLIRLERGSSGLGVSALIEQIEHWGPMLESASTAAPEAQVIKNRLQDIVKATGALGHGAFEALDRAIAESKNTESRKWLARCALTANRDLGIGLISRILRGTQHSPSPRLRWWAADELTRTDKAIAGKVLAQILVVESARGLRQLPPQLAPEYMTYMAPNSGPGFHNFIHRFYDTEYPDRANILLQVLLQAEHDQMTYKECIRYLGELKATAAIPTIEKFFLNPRGREMQNPFVLEQCLTALGSIQGKDACPFFDKALQSATNQRIVVKLHYLKQQYCN